MQQWLPDDATPKRETAACSVKAEDQGDLLSLLKTRGRTYYLQHLADYSNSAMKENPDVRNASNEARSAHSVPSQAMSVPPPFLHLNSNEAEPLLSCKPNNK